MLRQIRNNDQERVFELVKSMSEEALKGSWSVLLQDENFYGIVLEEEGETLGYASVSFYRSIVKGKTAVVEDVIVDEKARGKGLGRKLIQGLVREAQKRGCSIVVLTSNPKREVARRLYESEGFQLKDTGFFVKKLS